LFVEDRGDDRITTLVIRDLVGVDQNPAEGAGVIVHTTHELATFGWHPEHAIDHRNPRLGHRPGLTLAIGHKPKVSGILDQKEIQKIERQLDRLGKEELALHSEMAENATDFTRVAGLDAKLRELSGRRDELETRWLELADDA
jgi:hypothetical protein